MNIETTHLEAKDIALITTLMNPSGDEPAPVIFEANGEIGKLNITLDWCLDQDTEDAQWAIHLENQDEPDLAHLKKNLEKLLARTAP